MNELIERAGRDHGLADSVALVHEIDEARRDLRAALMTAPRRADAEDLVALSELRGVLSERVMSLRLQALARVHGGLARLRRQTTLQALLPRAAEELARCCDLERTVISQRRESTWKAVALWQHPDVDPQIAAETVAFLTDDWIPLSRGLLESDLIRRRAAEVIDADDPRTDKQLMAVTRSRAYVASPVMPAGRVIGFLQADRLVSGRPLTEHDRDNVWAFAQGFGLIVERVSLLERLDEQLDRARSAFAEAERQLDELAHDQIRLARSSAEPDIVATRAAQMFRPRTTHSGDLGDREREVMELLVTGARNSEIADRLLIGRETVKTHLSSIMRKLGATTRAEAVALWLQR